MMNQNIIQNPILIWNKFSWKNNWMDWTEIQFHSIESRIMSKTSMNGLLTTINCFIRKETRVALYFPQNWTRNHVIDSDNLVYKDLYFFIATGFSWVLSSMIEKYWLLHYQSKYISFTKQLVDVSKRNY